MQSLRPLDLQVLKNPRAPGDLYSLGRADCGTYSVVAPEVDNGHPVTPAADVWALGCCLLAWLCGDGDGTATLARVKEAQLEELLRKVPRRFGAKLRSALRMALQHHPQRRASAADIWKLLSTSGK
jgi:serine/threonine protein kinase